MELVKRKDRYDLYADDGRKIASTSPNPMGKLSLKNCQSIEQGFDLDKLAKEFQDVLLDNGWRESPSQKIAFIKGFQKALEIIGDKKFSEDDITSAMNRVWDWCEMQEDEECSSMTELRDKHFKLLQQTEWDVEIEMEQVYDGLDEMAQPQYYKQPKLDADGCLILKLKL